MSSNKPIQPIRNYSFPGGDYTYNDFAGFNGFGLTPKIIKSKNGGRAKNRILNLISFISSSTLIICIFVVITIGGIYLLLYTESYKLRMEDIDTEIACEKYITGDMKDYRCPYGYGESVCAKHDEDKYNWALCPLNYSLVSNTPPGKRNAIFKDAINGINVNESLFNNIYYEKKNTTIPKMLYCDTTLLQCTDILNNKPDIILRSGDIIKQSYSIEENNVKSYYLYVVIDIFTTFSIGINAPELNGDGEDNSLTRIIVNNLDDLLKAFDYIENSFKVSLTDEQFMKKDPNFTCDNVSKKDRENSEEYAKLCIFYEIDTIGNITESFIELFKDKGKKISRTIWIEYLELLNNKIYSNNWITLFEYIMYISLYNYLTKSNYKLIFDNIKFKLI